MTAYTRSSPELKNIGSRNRTLAIKTKSKWEFGHKELNQKQDYFVHKDLYQKQDSEQIKLNWDQEFGNKQDFRHKEPN